VTSHFLTTDAPTTNILQAAAPLIARLPNGDKVQSTRTCTLDQPDLLPAAQAAHIIPGTWHHTPSSLLSQCAMLDAGLTSPKSTAPLYTMATQLCMATYALAPACGWCPSPTYPTTKQQTQLLLTNTSPQLPPTMMPHPLPQYLSTPPSATLLMAPNHSHSEELTTISGLTPSLIKEHLPHLTSTNKGHMRHHQANTASMRNM
jgi:hypothetical protein